MRRQINTALIGYGTRGKFFHAPLIQVTEGLRLHTVLERSKNESKARYPDVHIARSLEEILSDKSIELVVITTPNETHDDFVKQALLADKHVIVDKPFSIKSSEATALIELSKKQNKKLTVYHNRRLDGDFLTVQKILHEKILGDLLEYEVHFDRFRPEIKQQAWREEDKPGSGILYDLGSHLIDQALVLFGIPEKISADVQIQRTGGKADDCFEIVLHYKTHKAILKAGMLVKEAGPHFILKGNQGTFIKYEMDPQENELKKGTSPVGKDWGEDPYENWGELNLEGKISKIKTQRGDYVEFYRNIYQAITEEAPLMVKAEEAMQVIRMIELAKKSSVDNKALLST